MTIVAVQQKDGTLLTLLLVLIKWPIIVPLLAVCSFWMFRKRSHSTNAQKFFANFYVGGHRGSPIMRPENTIESMEQAKREGADLIEFDVSLTKDGVAVILHDDTLERTTNMSGAIREKCYKDLAECNCAAKFQWECKNGSNEFKPTFMPMPTLEEIVRWAKDNGMKMLFDVKDSDQCLITKLEELYEAHQLYDTGIVSSFFPVVSYRIKHYNPRILTGLTWRRWFISYTDLRATIPRQSSRIVHALAMLLDIVYLWSVKSWLPGFLGVDMMLTDRYEISENYVQRQKEAGRVVVAWTVNDVNEMTWMSKTLNIPFLTDKPYLAQQAGLTQPNRQQQQVEC